MAWYIFTPPLMGPSNPSDPNQYTLNGTGAFPPSCPQNNRLCAIQAEDSGGHPILSEDLKNEIINAVNSKIESTNVLLKQ